MLPNTATPDLHLGDHGGHDHSDVKVFGFWLYLMTDCLIFAALFATFAVMRTSYAGGPTGKELFDLNNVAIETGLLLVSSMTYGLAMLAAYRQRTSQVLGWLAVTFLLGLGFVALEVHEFLGLVAIGAGPDRSAFLSSFFTLVATHGLHVTFGLIWMAVMMAHLLGKRTVSATTMTRLSCLSLFWHFLDIVWICVFSFVYLSSVV